MPAVPGRVTRRRRGPTATHLREPVLGPARCRVRVFEVQPAEPCNGLLVTAFTTICHNRTAASEHLLCRWRGEVDSTHRLLTSVVLGGAVSIAVVWPNTASVSAAWSGAALLIGGALIGVPHGSSDFVVAHRALKPTFGRVWLPAFLVGYLAIVAAVLFGWCVAPLPTLLVFVVLSGAHFGHGDLVAGECRRGLALAVRATTPLLPVLLLHPAGVTDIIALLGGVEEPAVARALDVLRWPLVLPWGAAVVWLVVPRIVQRARGLAGKRKRRDAMEITAIALAASTLPPLLAFALYFCFVHALRHLIDIADEYRPHDAQRAVFLVLAIVVPSASVCLVALASTWHGIAGSLGTTDVLAWSVRMIAALTVPHIALEAWVARTR